MKKGTCSSSSKVARRVAIGLLAGAGFVTTAGAQSGAQSGEPILSRVYRTAQEGRVDDARRLMEQVLRDHPKSAQAHFVNAQLLARQGLFGAARDELAAAQRIAPGLPFARADVVSALRADLDRLGEAAAPARGASTGPSPQHRSAQPGFQPWNRLLAVAAGGIVAWLLTLTNRQHAPPSANQSPAASAEAGYAVGGASTSWPQPAAAAPARAEPALGRQPTGRPWARASGTPGAVPRPLASAMAQRQNSVSTGVAKR